MAGDLLLIFKFFGLPFFCHPEPIACFYAFLIIPEEFQFTLGIIKSPLAVFFSSDKVSFLEQLTIFIIELPGPFRQAMLVSAVSFQGAIFIVENPRAFV